MLHSPIQLISINIDKLILTTNSEFNLDEEEETFDLREHISLALSEDNRFAKVKLGLKVDPEGKPIAFDIEVTAHLKYSSSQLPEDTSVLKDQFTVIGCNAIYGIIKCQIYNLTSYTFVGPRMLPIASFIDIKDRKINQPKNDNTH